jgi:hypothetical protein
VGRAAGRGRERAHPAKAIVAFGATAKRVATTTQKLACSNTQAPAAAGSRGGGGAMICPLTISTGPLACAKLAWRRGEQGMHVVGWFFTWIDSWTAPYEVIILAGLVTAFLSWTLRTSR